MEPFLLGDSMSKCRVDGCQKKKRVFGLCGMHAKRLKAHGDVRAEIPCMRAPFEERFWGKVEKSDGCWLWTGSRLSRGYGQIGRNGKVILATRASYEIHYGEFEQTLCVLHRCDNPACVRPDHLFLGTHYDNMKDMMEKGRHRTAPQPKGSSNKKSKLTEIQVISIRKRFHDGERKSAISRDFNVSATLINMIVKRIIWNHI